MVESLAAWPTEISYSCCQHQIAPELTPEHDFSGEACPYPSSSRRGSSIVIVGSLGLLSSWSTAIEKLSHRKCSHDMSVCKVKLNRNKAIFILASVYVHQCPCYQAPLYTGILCIYIIYIMYAWVEPNDGFPGTWTFALTISQSVKSDLPNNYYRRTVYLWELMNR